MFKHIVMWELDDSVPDSLKKENAEMIKSSLEKLPSLIPQIVSYEVGINLQAGDRTSDLVLISEFHDQKDYEIYRSHREHLKVVEIVSELTLKTRFVDFLTNEE